MNRDHGRLLFGLSDNPLADGAADLIGIPPRHPDDFAGKIYRLNLDNDTAEWELMFEMDGITGWRRMIIFNDDLFVLAGLSDVRRGLDYSVVLRFRPDFEYGDQPDIVMWDFAIQAEFYRAAAVYDGRLYIGTFDTSIFVTDGTDLQNLTPGADLVPNPNYPAAGRPMIPRPGSNHAGWQRLVMINHGPAPVGYIGDRAGVIWDLIGFNGYIYAIVTNPEGFVMYKINPVTRATTQIVGSSAEAQFPRGMGIRANVTASPFVFTVDGTEYVYITTFSNGPTFVVQFARGAAGALPDIIAPSQIYRFDADDNWELLVGDSEGYFAARNAAGEIMQPLGQNRAGFFTGEGQNFSMNQYIWWMAEYNGRLYATTWDISMWKQHITGFTILTFAGMLNAENPEILQRLAPAITPLVTFLYRGDAGLFRSICLFFRAVWGVIRVLPTLFVNFRVLLATFRQARAEIALLDGYLAYTGNPEGFDLWVSDDGINFEPVTTDGFGRPEDFGGRIMLGSEEYGLFLGTANPFTGARMYRLNATQ